MIKFAHLIMIPFTGVGTGNGFKSEEWFKYRIKIFKNYTLKSLLNQKNRAFLVWLTFRPEERNHPLVKELGEYLNQVKMPTVMTFDGLMYWDDKFSPGIKNVILNIGRVSRQMWREKRFSFKPFIEILFFTKNRSLLNRIERSVYEIAQIKELQDANYVYVTRLDSDDLLHQDAIDEIQKVPPFEGAMVYKEGFIYHTISKEMAEWVPRTNPPFHTISFLGSRFFNPVEHLNFYKDFRSHEDITRVFKTYTLSEGRYCVLIHNNHISTIWDHPFKGLEVDPNLIKDFGIE